MIPVTPRCVATGESVSRRNAKMNSSVSSKKRAQEPGRMIEKRHPDFNSQRLDHPDVVRDAPGGDGYYQRCMPEKFFTLNVACTNKTDRNLDSGTATMIAVRNHHFGPIGQRKQKKPSRKHLRRDACQSSHC